MSAQFNRTRNSFADSTIEELESIAEHIELTVIRDENDTDVTACFSVSIDDLI